MEHGRSDPGLSQAELIDAMVQYRVLFERHIVLANEQAAMGCHPEQIFTIF